MLIVVLFGVIVMENFDVMVSLVRMVMLIFIKVIVVNFAYFLVLV